MNNNPEPDYTPLAQFQLARLICRDWDQRAYEEWQRRHGHDFPTVAIINNQEIKYTE